MKTPSPSGLYRGVRLPAVWRWRKINMYQDVRQEAAAGEGENNDSCICLDTHLFLLSNSSSFFQDFWLTSSQFCFPRGSVYSLCVSSSSSSFHHPLLFFFCGIYSVSPDASSSLLCWPTLVSDAALFLHLFAFSLVFLLLLLPVDSSQLIRLFWRQKDFRDPQCFYLLPDFLLDHFLLLSIVHQFWSFCLHLPPLRRFSQNLRSRALVLFNTTLKVCVFFFYPSNDSDELRSW